MDRDRLKVHHRTVEQGCKGEVEGYIEAPGAESSKYSTFKVRRSSRLLSKKRESLSTQDVFGSGHNDCKNTTDSPKESVVKNKFISESKGGLDNIHAHETASIKSSTPVSCFRYHVRSKDGIRLVVDLNSSQSEWLRSMENSVCICQKHQKTEFRSFRQELEYLGDSNSLTRSSLAKTNASGVGMNSYENTFSNPDPLTTEIGSRGIDGQHGGDELSTICMTKRLQDDCCPHADSATHQKGLSSSKNGFENFICRASNIEAEDSILTSANEANQETFRSHAHLTVEDWERANSAKRTEVSEQENVLMKLASDDGLKRKKDDRECDLICLQHDGRILRSTKLLGGRIIKRGGVILRRSSRLVLKVLNEGNFRPISSKTQSVPL